MKVNLENNGSQLFEDADEAADVLKQRIANEECLLDAQDIYACLHDHKITGTVKDIADDFLKEQKGKDTKTIAERD